MNNEHCICVRKENNTHGLGWRRRPAVLLLACAAGAFALVPPAGAVSGATPWAVLRCQLSDQPLPPVPESFYQDFFTAAGAAKGGLYDYWGQVSMGRVTLAGTQIFQWVPLYITSVQDPQRPRQKQVQD